MYAEPLSNRTVPLLSKLMPPCLGKVQVQDPVPSTLSSYIHLRLGAAAKADCGRHDTIDQGSAVAASDGLRSLT